MDVNYDDIFQDFREKVATDSDLSANEITKRIKDYFANKYDSYTVIYSDKSTKNTEYLTDVLVTNFKPKEIAVRKGNQFKVPATTIIALLAVESELGGEGGTSTGPVLKNVIEDFVKLLLIKSKYKILIFTSVPLKDEKDYLQNRVDVLKNVKDKSGSSNEEILLIHLFGNTHKSESGNPRQINVSLKSSGMKGFLLKANHVIELNA